MLLLFDGHQKAEGAGAMSRWLSSPSMSSKSSKWRPWDLNPGLAGESRVSYPSAMLDARFPLYRRRGAPKTPLSTDPSLEGVSPVLRLTLFFVAAGVLRFRTCDSKLSSLYSLHWATLTLMLM